MDLTRDLSLVERCANAYDIYKKSVSSLTYAPDCYVVYKNGRKIPGIAPFNTVEDAKGYINGINGALYELIDKEVA